MGSSCKGRTCGLAFLSLCPWGAGPVVEGQGAKSSEPGRGSGWMTFSVFPLTSGCSHPLRDRKERGSWGLVSTLLLSPWLLGRKEGAASLSSVFSSSVSVCVRPVVVKPSLISEPFVPSGCYLGAPNPPGNLLRNTWDPLERVWKSRICFFQHG